MKISDFVFVFVAGLAIGYFLGSDRASCVRSVHQVDTVVVRDTIRLPASSGRLPARVLPRVDSSDAVARQRALDSLKATVADKDSLAERLAEPFGTEIDSANFYLKIKADPLLRTIEYELNVKPIPVEVLVPVERKVEVTFWEKAEWVAYGAVVGMVFVLIVSS